MKDIEGEEASEDWFTEGRDPSLEEELGMGGLEASFDGTFVWPSEEGDVKLVIVGDNLRLTEAVLLGRVAAWDGLGATRMVPAVREVGETETLPEGVGTSVMLKLLTEEASFEACWLFE